jgi:hypothetical protein
MIKVNAIIEVKAIEKDLLKKQMKDIVKLLDKERIRFYNSSVGEIIEEDGFFSSFIEFDADFDGFEQLAHFIFFFSPVFVGIRKMDPISQADLQNGINEMTHMVNGYNKYILTLMSREELRKMNEKLFETMR